MEEVRDRFFISFRWMKDGDVTLLEETNLIF